MRVSWITADKHVPSIVEYGTDSGTYAVTATGEQTSYRYFSYVSGKIHHVKIGPLLPDTVYYYRCGGAGDEFSFKTLPSVLPMEFAVTGKLKFQHGLIGLYCVQVM
jgi:acid phosphatase type 7